jgi:membrane protein
MAINLNGIRSGRAAMPIRSLLIPERLPIETTLGIRSKIVNRISKVLHWMHRGYQHANAGDLAAAIAYNALVALIPTLLLTLSVAGLFFRLDEVFETTVYTSFWGLPDSAAGDAIKTVLTARRSSSWLGVVSLAGFAWTGTAFVGCLSRAMNRIYGVPGCGYMCEKRRGFFVIIGFAALFTLSLVASTVPTLFVRQDLPRYFETWALAGARYQVLGYVLAFIATALLFGMLYRVVPNAGQHLGDVWPGTLTAATIFVAMAQVFPIYIRVLGGFNRYGAAFGLLSLLVAWFWLLAHVLLFGTYVNATWQRHRYLEARRRRQVVQSDRHQS